MLGVLLNAAFVFCDKLTNWTKHPTVGQISVGKVVVLVRIAAEVVDHGQLRLDVATLWMAFTYTYVDVPRSGSMSMNEDVVPGR
jgi:hypothetical protein